MRHVNEILEHRRVNEIEVSQYGAQERTRSLAQSRPAAVSADAPFHS